MTGHVAQFHLDDDYWQTALQSIRKALRPGGHLVFESRNPEVQPWIKEDQVDNVDWYAPNFRKKVVDPLTGQIEVWQEVKSIQGNKVTTDMRYLFTKTGEELLSTNTLIFRTKKRLKHPSMMRVFLLKMFMATGTGA